jgi:hypothetical protein
MENLEKIVPSDLVCGYPEKSQRDSLLPIERQANAAAHSLLVHIAEVELSSETHFVCAVVEVCDDILALSRSEDKHIRPRTSCQLIIPFAAVDQILSGPTQDDVPRSVTDQPVSACTTEQSIFARSATQGVFPIETKEHIAPLKGSDAGECKIVR